MLKQEELDKIKELLDHASNPVFFFDNDVDGLASFLLLRRYCGKGKGVAIKSYPDLGAVYSRKLHEFSPDTVFVLDKPMVAKEFVQEMEQLNCNMVWIDHHPSNINEFKDKLGKNIFYFNPLMNGESNEPTSYLCYNAIRKKDDEWIALLGCLADWFIPPFAKEFSQENHDFFPYTEDPAKAFFTTPIGTMVRVLDFALKDRTTNIVRTLKILLDIKNYKDLTEENNKTIPVFARFKQINKKYQKILEKGKKMKTGKLLFFRYGGALSLSSELANELFYLNQDKVVVVAYTKGNKANVSVRGLINVRDLACNALKGMEATCGGHKNACGATVSVDNLGRFRGNLLRMLDTGNYI